MAGRGNVWAGRGKVWSMELPRESLVDPRCRFYGVKGPRESMMTPGDNSLENQDKQGRDTQGRYVRYGGGLAR